MYTVAASATNYHEHMYIHVHVCEYLYVETKLIGLTRGQSHLDTFCEDTANV